MGRKRGEALLNRINATFQTKSGLVSDKRKRLRKAESQKAAESIERKLEAWSVKSKHSSGSKSAQTRHHPTISEER